MAGSRKAIVARRSGTPGHLSGTRDAALTENARSFLARAQGQAVRVVFRDRELRGKLAGADEFINLHMEDAEEITPTGTRKLGHVVVRGSQVIAVHATKLGPPVAEVPVDPYGAGRRDDRGGYYPRRNDHYRDGPYRR